jgi:YVTN family beta-propeller protein
MRHGVLVLTLGLFSATIIPAPTAGDTKLDVGNFQNGSLLPTGQFITPVAAPGSTIQVLATGLRADGDADGAQAVNTALSPDGRTLLVLTSGWNRDNRLPDGTSLTYPGIDPVTGAPSGQTTHAEWVFVYTVNADGSVTKQQQIDVASTYSGLTWAPDGTRFYVSGGANDRVYVYRFDGTRFVADAPFILLGHNSNQTAPFSTPDGNILKGTRAARVVPIILAPAIVAGVGVSRDGRTLVAANFENDSVSIADTTGRNVVREVKFFTPGGAVAQGEFPYDVAVVSGADGAARTAYVTSQRDDQVMAVDVATGAFTAIPVGGQPNRMSLSRDGGTLYVVNGNTNSISVVDTASNAVTRTISLSRPGDRLAGSNPNAAALSPDERTLYVTLGTENAVAVVSLRAGRVVGRIPTGWYPTSLSVSADGRRLYVCTFKSNAGPNPQNAVANPAFKNSRSWPLEKAQLNIIPVPNDGALERLSRQVDRNNGVGGRDDGDGNDQGDGGDHDDDRPDMAFLSQRIKHVIYIVKENKTYDQVLGDLPRGNGDPSLTLYPQAVTPNHHALALTFGLLDNFYAVGEVSGTGWNWSTYANTTDYDEKTIAVNYGNGGPSYDAEGTNRLIGIGLPDFASPPSQFTVRLTTLLDPTGSSAILPGPKDVNAPAGASDVDPGAVGGYIWDAAIRAGKSVRNYGFFVDQAYYVSTGGDPTKPDPRLPTYLPISPRPFDDNLPQAVALTAPLQGRTDVFFRGFDQNNADTYLFNEWVRDVTANGLADLTLLRLPHDHFGSFATALAGLGTPSLQIADNDYAIGKVVDFISHSDRWRDTAIFILEDDAQNGGDHVDSHRSFVYALSAYSKRGRTISTNYNTVNVLRTMEDLLGIAHLNFRDANAQPMKDVFSRVPDFTPYTAIIPGSLCAAPVDPNLVPACATGSAALQSPPVPDLHGRAWWAGRTSRFDFSREDRIDADAFNRVLVEGITGSSGRRTRPRGATRAPARSLAAAR